MRRLVLGALVLASSYLGMSSLGCSNGPTDPPPDTRQGKADEGGGSYYPTEGGGFYDDNEGGGAAPGGAPDNEGGGYYEGPGYSGDEGPGYSGDEGPGYSGNLEGAGYSGMSVGAADSDNSGCPSGYTDNGSCDGNVRVYCSHPWFGSPYGVVEDCAKTNKICVVSRGVAECVY
jgi:hypothetical protein